MLLLGVVVLADPALTLPDAAVARRRAAAARDRLAAVTRGAARPERTHAHAPTSTSARTPASAQAQAQAQAPAPAPAPAPTLAPTPTPAPAPAAATTGLEIRGLVAGWDMDQPPALSDLDLDLPAGERVAVLGASGSGKSTLAAVLVRLLDHRAGTVRVGGVDLCSVPAAEVHHRVCLVGDEVDHIFASTVRENLRLAGPAATDGDLRTALRRVRLAGWLNALPDGLDTWLGAAGTTVSGGERRRFAAARALLADPDLLILDEPTEGLDEATASALMADLLAATAGRSVLLLTHRRDGLDHVDATYHLSGGRLRRDRVPVNSSA
jgi:ATP-binding cassette subfamily C protein CydCD